MEPIKLKIRKEFWEDIVSGKKKYEIRKLRSGLTSDYYFFIDEFTEEQLGIAKLKPIITIPREVEKKGKGYKMNWELYLQFGQDNYNFSECEIIKGKGECHKSCGISYSNKPVCHEEGRTHKHSCAWTIYAEGYYDIDIATIDDETMKFFFDNYLEKHDVVVYEISEVSDAR